MRNYYYPAFRNINRYIGSISADISTYIRNAYAPAYQQALRQEMATRTLEFGSISLMMYAHNSQTSLPSGYILQTEYKVDGDYRAVTERFSYAKLLSLKLPNIDPGAQEHVQTLLDACHRYEVLSNELHEIEMREDNEGHLEFYIPGISMFKKQNIKRVCPRKPKDPAPKLSEQSQATFIELTLKQFWNYI